MEKYYDFTFVASGGEEIRTSLAFLRRDTWYFHAFRPGDKHVSEFDAPTIIEMVRMLTSRDLPKFTSIWKLLRLMAAFYYYGMQHQLDLFSEEIHNIRFELDDEMVEFVIESVPYYLSTCFRCKSLKTWSKVMNAFAFTDVDFDAEDVHAYLTINVSDEEWFKSFRDVLVLKLSSVTESIKRQYIELINEMGDEDSLRDKVLDLMCSDKKLMDPLKMKTAEEFIRASF